MMTAMLRIVLLAALFLLSGSGAFATEITGDATAGAQVQQIFKHWVAAYDKGDLDGTMAIFAKDVVFAFQGSKDQGYEDLRKSYVDDFASRQPGTTWAPELEEIHTEGTVAIVRSLWELRVKSGSGETQVKARNRSVDILSKSSGKWHIIRSFNYPQKP